MRTACHWKKRSLDESAMRCAEALILNLEPGVLELFPACIGKPGKNVKTFETKPEDRGANPHPATPR